MKNLTLQEKQRLWKQSKNPIRKILLWGLDSKKNPCLLILYGEQKFEREIKSSPNSYYTEAYILEPAVVYTNYTIFHGVNGHLPSIPNTYYDKENNILCYMKGYKTAYEHWYYDRTTGYRKVLDIDKKYIINKFYKIDKNITFNYYEKNTYADYVSFLKSNEIKFEDFELIDEPSVLFGFKPDSLYYESVLNMFLKERLYARRKYLSQFIEAQPSVEDYEQILKVASVELACGIFQELTMKKNPILLETAKQIDKSKVLWAKEAYHNGLKRCLKQYISIFDEKLMQEQKEFIYKTLPEMDFCIKKLKLNNKVLEGKELEEYLNAPYSYYNIYYIFGNQNLYKKNTYTDGKNIYNIRFKDTIQTAKAYGMADAIGRIAYYLDAPRTVCYLRGSGRTGAYKYYQRYLRRTIDKYKEEDEEKFMTVAREMLTNYTDNDDLGMYINYFGDNFFFNRYFRNVILDNTAANELIWHKNINDIIYIAKNAKAFPVHEFCYAILKKSNEQHTFDLYEIKELIELSKIKYDKTAKLFIKILLPKLKELQEFDTNIMISLMGANSEKLQNAANEYFKRTNGKFSPKDVVDFLFLDTIEIWYTVFENNINNFSSQEYIVFMKSLIEKSEEFIEQNIEFSEQIIDLIQNSVEKIDTFSIEEKQELLHYFISLLLSIKKLPDFLFEIMENIIFFMPYDLLKDTLNNIDLQHSRITEKEYNIVSLLKSIKESILPKNSVILSILDIGSARLVKTLTEVINRLQTTLTEKDTLLLLLFECNVYPLNKVAQSVFESMEIEKREKLHMILLDSPIQKAYQYGLQKLNDWYGNKVPKKFILRMLEHPCIDVKSYISKKIKETLSNLNEAQPDLYIYYIKTLLYLPNRVSKSKEYIYKTIPEFLKCYPEKQKEIECILLDIGSTSIKIDSERALVAFAQIQKEVSSL